MNYDKIMQEITSGMTGDMNADAMYLYTQFEKYENNESAQEILKGISGLISELIPEDELDAATQRISDFTNDYETSIDEARTQIHEQNYDKALDIFESLVKKYEDGNLRMFRNDSDSEHRYFYNTLEEILYKEVFKPERPVLEQIVDYRLLYFNYGVLLFQFKRYDEARVALNKAIDVNPVNVTAIFELAEISKIEKDWDKFIELTKQCLKFGYTRDVIGRCYRNLGHYYVEMQKYDEAIALYYMSMYFDIKSKMAPSQIAYIQEVTGKQFEPPSMDEMLEIFEKDDIQIGSNDVVNSIAAALGQSALDDKDYDAAKFYLGILYDLTHDEDVKGFIDVLNDKENEENVEKFLELSSDKTANVGKFDGESEISFNIKTKEDAIRLMKEHNQRCIWDWKNEEAIFNEDYEQSDNDRIEAGYEATNEIVEGIKKGEDKAVLLKGLTEEELKDVVRVYIGNGNGTTQVKASCIQTWRKYI